MNNSYKVKIKQTSSEINIESVMHLEGDNAVGRKKLKYEFAQSTPKAK